MSQADYEIVKVTGTVVSLIDLDIGSKSVTNDAEAVVQEVTKLHGDRRIAYRDSDGRWCELRHNGQDFVGFSPWAEPTPVH